MENIDYLVTKFTIRPKTQLFKLTFPVTRHPSNLSTIIRYVRRFSPHAYVVRGRKNGIHYHGIAYIPDVSKLRKSTKFKCRVEALWKSSKPVYFESKEEEYERLRYENEEIIDQLRKSIEITPPLALSITRRLHNMVTDYWNANLHDQSKLRRRARAKRTQQRFVFAVTSWLNYLEKNLLENEPTDRSMYEAYQYIEKNPKR